MYIALELRAWGLGFCLGSKNLRLMFPVVAEVAARTEDDGLHLLLQRLYIDTRVAMGGVC